MKKLIIKNILIFVASFILFFLVTYPTRGIFTVFSATDVRPGIALNPLLSMCFGPAAILGVTVATTLGDYLAGYPSPILYQGFVFQFLYGLVSFIVWKLLTKNDDHRYRLDSLPKIAKFAAVALSFAIISCLGVSLIIYWNFGVSIKDTIGFVFLNNFDFTMILGMPILILSNIIVHKVSSGVFRKLSVNEKLILINFLADFIALVIVIFFTYKGFHGMQTDIYTIWNTIYMRSVVIINIILAVTALCMYRSESLCSNT